MTGDDEDVVAFLAKWEQLGREAIGALAIAPRPLRKIIADCSGLIVTQTWIDNGMNISEMARILDISRRRGREILKAWHTAQGLLVATIPSRRTRFVRGPGASPPTKGE